MDMKKGAIIVLVFLLIGCAPEQVQDEELVSDYGKEKVETQKLDEVKPMEKESKPERAEAIDPVELDPLKDDSGIQPAMQGSFRCWQYNVQGGGGSCRTAQPIILNEDGTYQESSTSG